MVPGSTLRYGSNFWITTLNPRLFSIRPNEAAVMPLPRDETTPPVTNTCFAMYLSSPVAVESGRGGTRGPAPHLVYQAYLRPVFQRPCERQCPLVSGRPAQHPGQFLQAPLAVENLEAGHAAACRDLLADEIVAVGEGGYLGQMRDHDHLTVPRCLSQLGAHCCGCEPAYAGVDLIEHHGLRRLASSQSGLDRQQHARQLASRSSAREAARLHSNVRRKEELHRVR